MTTIPESPIVSPLDPATRSLVRLAAAAAGSSEGVIRQTVAEAVRDSRAEWVEEVVLQTYLFAGFPRALNTAREWRRSVDAARTASVPAADGGGDSVSATDGSGEAANDQMDDYTRASDWRARGEETCSIVYGPAYDKLRTNIRALHPLLDSWMIVEGYGKVLSRPQLDLVRRELCIVAACATSGQDRQLHSHLHGAMHAGAGLQAIDDTLDAVANLMTPDRAREVRMLWARVRMQHEERDEAAEA